MRLASAKAFPPPSRCVATLPPLPFPSYLPFGASSSVLPSRCSRRSQPPPLPRSPVRRRGLAGPPPRPPQPTTPRAPLPRLRRLHAPPSPTASAPSAPLRVTREVARSPHRDAAVDGRLAEAGVRREFSDPPTATHPSLQQQLIWDFCTIPVLELTRVVSVPRHCIRRLLAAM
jgi:hypothetical protein